MTVEEFINSLPQEMFSDDPEVAQTALEKLQERCMHPTCCSDEITMRLECIRCGKDLGPYDHTMRYGDVIKI